MPNRFITHSSNWILRIFGALLVVLLLTIIIIPFINWSSLRPDVSATLSEWLGMPIAINGDIQIEIFPRPRLIARDVSVQDKAIDLRTNKIAFQLAWLPMLTGEFSLNSAQLDDFTLAYEPPNTKTLRIRSKRRNNAQPVPSIGELAETTGDISERIRLQTVQIRHGLFILGTLDKPIAQYNIDRAEISAGSLRGPFHMDGKILLKSYAQWAPPLQQLQDFSLDLGVDVTHSAIPLQLKLSSCDKDKPWLDFQGAWQLRAVTAAYRGADFLGDLALHPYSLNCSQAPAEHTDPNYAIAFTWRDLAAERINSKALFSAIAVKH